MAIDNINDPWRNEEEQPEIQAAPPPAPSQPVQEEQPAQQEPVAEEQAQPAEAAPVETTPQEQSIAPIQQTDEIAQQPTLRDILYGENTQKFLQPGDDSTMAYDRWQEAREKYFADNWSKDWEKPENYGSFRERLLKDKGFYEHQQFVQEVLGRIKKVQNALANNPAWEPESGFDADQLELLGRIVDSDKIRMDATPEGQQKLKALYDVLDTDADTAGSTSYEHTVADTAFKGLVSGVDMVTGLFRTASEAVGGMVGNISSDEQKMRHLERNLFEAHEARPENISSKNLFSSEASAADWADAVVYNLCEQLPLMAALEVGGAVAGLLGRGAAWGTKAVGAARSAEGFAVGMGTKAAAQTAAKAGAVETAAKVGANRAALLNTLHAAEVASRKIGAIATDFAVNLGDTFGTQVDNAIAADKDLGALDYALTAAGTGVKTGIDFITGKGMAAMAARTPIRKMLTSEAKIALTAAGDNAAMDALRFARATFLDAASETGQEVAQKAVDRTINRIRNKTWLMDGEQKATDAFWNDLDEGLGAGLATLVMGGAGSVGRYKAERKQIASDLKNGTGLFNDKTRAALNRFVRDANLSGNFSDLSPEDRMSLLSAFRAYAQQQVNDRAVNTTPDQIVAEDAKKGKTTSILEASQRLASVAASSAQNAAQYGRTVDELVDGMSEKAKAWFNAYKQGFQIESFEDYRKALASAKGDDQERLKPSFDIEAAERNYNTCVARANADGSETVLFDDSPKGDGDGGRIWIRGYRDEDGEMVYTIGRMDGGVMPLTENENIRGSQMEGDTVEARDNAALDAALQFASDLSGWAEFQKAREDSMQAFANALVAKGGRNQGLNVRIVRSWNDLRDLENSNALSDKAKATMQDRDSPNGLSQNWTGFSEGGIVFVNRSKVANPFQLAAILDHEGFHDKLSRMASEAMGKNATLKIAGVSLNEIPPKYRRDAFVADLLGIDTTGGFTEELLGEIERAEEELAYGGEGARRSEMDREGLFRNFMRKNKMLSWLLPDYIAGETGIRPSTEQEVSDFLFTVLGVGSKDGKDGTVIYGQNPRGLDNTTPAGTTAASVMQKSRFESQKRAADNPVQAAVNEAMANGEEGGAAEPRPASTSTPTPREGGVEQQQKKQESKAAPAPAKKEAKPAAEKPAAPKKEPAKKPAAEKPNKTEPVKTEPVVPEKPKAKPKTNEQVIAALDANGAFLKMPFKTKASPVNNNLVPKISANQAIANYSGRRVVVVELNGVRVPFYLSTGNGRKATVQDGKWYPFFGIGSDGWMNKGTESQINEYYGSPELRAVASWLDENIGDIQPIGQSGPNMVSFDDGGNADFVNFISRDLVPIRHEKSGTKDGRETLDLSISNTVSRVRGANISSFVVAAKPAVQKTEAPAKPAPAAKKLPPVSNKGKPAVLRTLMPKAKAAVKAMLDWLQKGTYTPGTYGKEPVRMIPMTYRSKGGEVVKSPIVVHNGRPYILLDMGGVSVPWYLNNAKTQWLPAIEGADSAKIGDKQILGSRSMHFVSQTLMQEIGNGFAVIRGDDFKDYQTGKGETLDAVKMLDAETGRKAIEAFTTKENDAVDPETLVPKQAEREDQSFEGRLREQKKAADPATKPEDLASLATSSDDSVRLEVASNPSTPKEALRVLATDTNAIVGSMARRRFTDAELKKIDADFEKATRSIANGTARGAQANVAETENGGGKRRIGPRNRTEGKAKRNYVSIPKDIADAIAVAFRRNLGIKTETQESDPAGAKASAEKAAAYVKAEFKKLGMTDADISAHMGAFYDGVEDILKGGGAVAKESGKGGQKKNGKGTKSLRADKRETTKPVASGSAANWTPPAKTTKTKTNAKGQKTLKTEPVKTEPVKTEPVAPAPQKKRGQSDEAKARVAAKKEADAAQRKANANKGEKKRSLKANQRVDVSRFTTTGETDANGRSVLTKFGEALDTANSVLEGNRESLGGRVRRPTRSQLDPENMLVETMTLAESNALTFNYLVGQANTLLAVLDRPTVTQEEYDKLPQTERINVATPEMKAKAKQRLERGDMSAVRGKTLKNLSEKRKEGKATDDEVAQLRSLAGQTERGIIPQLKALLGPEGRGVIDKMMRGEDVTADLGAAVDRWDAEQKERNIEGVQRWGASPGNARVLVNREERKAAETDEKRAKREANRETMESEREGSQANAAEPAKQRKNLYDTPEKAAVAKFTQNDQKVLAQLKDPNGKSLADILYSVKVNRTYQRKDGTVTKTRNRRSGGVVASGIGAVQNPSVLNMIHIALRDALNSIDGQKFADGYERLLGEVEQRWRTVTGHDFNSTDSDNIRKRFEPFFPVGMDYNVAPRILSDEQREVMAEESGIIRKVDASGEAVDNFRLGDDDAFVQSLEDAYNSIQEDEGRDVRIQADRALDESGAYESNNQSDRVQQFRQGRASSIGSLLLSRVGDDYILPNGQTKKQAMDGLREAIRRVGNRKWAELPDSEKDAIFDDTGWEMRADGEWGFRVPPIRFNEDFHEELERALLMEDRVEFNLLDVLDPDSAAMVEAMDDVQTVELDDGASIENRQFGDIKVVARPTDEADEHFGDTAWYDPINQEIVLTPAALDNAADSGLSLDLAITHEMQHVIQEAEGWSDRTPGNATSGRAYNNAMSEVDARAQEALLEQEYEDSIAAAEGPLQATRQETVEDVPRSEQMSSSGGRASDLGSLLEARSEGGVSSGRASSIASLIDAQGGGTAWEGRNSALKHRFRTWLGNHFQFDHDKKGFAAIFAEGQAIVGDNPAMAQGIVDRAVDNFENKEEWSPSAKELTVLYMEELCREMRYQDTVKAWEAANARGVSLAELEKVRAEMVAARADMFLFAKALSFAKTGQGRALAANQMMLAEDFSFAGIVDRVNRAIDTDRAAQRHPESRRPLTEEEIEKYGVLDYAKDVQAKQTALSDIEDAISEEDAQEAVQTAVGNAADRHGKERKAGRNPATVSAAVAAAKDTLAKRIGEGGWFDPSDYAETWGALHDIVKKVGDAIVGEAVDNGDETMSHDAFVERLAKEMDAIVRSMGGDTAAEIADALEPMLYRDLYAGVGRLDKVIPTARSRKAAAIARMRELAMAEAELERVKAGEPMPERFAKIGLKAEDVDEELAKVRAELSGLLRKSGMSSRNPNLKSTPLDRVKEGLERQMADLQEAIDNNEALPRKAQGGVILDEEAKQMRRRLAELRGIYDQHFGPKAEPMSDAQRLESLRQRLSEAAAQAEAMLADVTSGRWNPDAPTHAGRTYVADKTADALRAKIHDLRAAIESAKNQAAPEQMAQTRLEAAIQAQQNRQARYESAINQGVIRKPRTFSLRETQDERWVNAFMAAEKAKKEFATLKGKILFDRKTALGKAWARANSIKDTMRAYMASGDISGLGVQCAWYVLQHPGKAMKTVIPGLRAFFSPEYAEKITRQIMADPDYRIMAEKMGVSFSLYGIESGFTQTEEAFARGEAARRLGSVSNNWYLDASERGFIVPINLCRYALAKEYLETLRDMRGENGEINADELKYLGRIVNITTGKGDFFGNAGASNFLSQILWAPSRVSSQIQILALPLTILGHDEIGKDMRMMIAKDAIARPIKHLAAIMLLTAMAGRLLRPDDDDEEIIGTDPTSSKFGKVKIGNRYISVTGGLEQYITILAKSITGFTRGKNGKKVDLRGGFGRNLEGEWLRLFKNKLRPDISMLWQWMVGRDNNGQTIGPGVWGKNGYLHFVARNGFIPLTGGDIYEALEDVNTNGVPLSMLFAAMAFVGWTGSNYGETPYTHDLARYNRAKEAMDEAQTEEEARLIAARPENHRYVGISAQLDANLKEQKQLESLLKNGEPAGKDLRGKKKYRPLFPREKERAKERLEELQIEFHQACWPEVYQ